MDTRKADLDYLRQAHKIASPEAKKIIEKAGAKIRRESGEVKAMRQALLKEHRQGRTDNIKDIHEIVKKKTKYQNY